MTVQSPESLQLHQEKEQRRRAVQEVAYNLKERIRQELAFPAVVHFYSWLLQGTLTLTLTLHLNHHCLYVGCAASTCRR